MNVIESVTHRENDNLVRLTCGHKVITSNPHVRAGNQWANCEDCAIAARRKLDLPHPDKVLDALVDDYVTTMQAQGHAIATVDKVAIRRAANIQYAWYCAMRRVLPVLLLCVVAFGAWAVQVTDVPRAPTFDAPVIGSCPKPAAVIVHHKHHAKPVPLCTCVADAPRTIMLPAPEPDIELIPLSVYPYYTVISFSDDPTPEPEYAGNYWYDEPVQVWSAGGRQTITTVTAGRGFRRTVGPSLPRDVRAPEIDATSANAALTLLAGALAVLRGRRSTSSGEVKHGS